MATDTATARMPAEWAPHERTLMAWPARASLWGAALGRAKEEYAGVANAIAAFEPVTMVVPPGASEEARGMLGAAVELVELPLDDSWLRDSGPVFRLDGAGTRSAVHFRFNGWGERFTPYDADEAAGGTLARRYAEEVVAADIVLEGGSIAVDGEGVLLTTEQCLLRGRRNPGRTREEIDERLRRLLGVTDVVWLGDGLVEDRDTDGHVDLIAAFTRPGEVLLCVPPDGPDAEPMAANAERLRAAGLNVRPFELLTHVDVAGERAVASYLNFYLCNGALILPLFGADTDHAAMEQIAAAYPGREIVGVPAATIAYGGGGPHCITQQVPAVRAPAS